MYAILTTTKLERFYFLGRTSLMERSGGVFECPDVDADVDA